MNPVFPLAVVAGLALLAWSADHLVVGSSRLAARLGVPTLVVGVVVIGFGTSAPEMLVSGLAAAGGAADVGVGNVIGSNLANLTLVLAVAALVAPVAVHSGVVRREAPLSLAASALFAALLQGGLSRLDGMILAGAMLAALGLLLYWTAAARRAAHPTPAGAPGDDGDDDLLLEHEVAELVDRPDLRRETLRALGGLVGTLAGAQLLVRGAVGIAEATGLSGGFVGLTIVAIGTSLPELLTAAQASRRGQSDLLVGNLLGSNIFNALTVGSIVALLAPGAHIDQSLAVNGTVFLLGASALSLLFMWRRYTVLRLEAAILLGAYIALLPALGG